MSGVKLLLFWYYIEKHYCGTLVYYIRKYTINNYNSKKFNKNSLLQFGPQKAERKLCS